MKDTEESLPNVHLTYVVLRPHGHQTTALVGTLVGDPCNAHAVRLEEAAYAAPATIAIVWVEGELRRPTQVNRYGPNWFYRITYRSEHLENVGGSLKVPERAAKASLVVFVRRLNCEELKRRQSDFLNAIQRMHKRCQDLALREVTCEFNESDLERSQLAA